MFKLLVAAFIAIGLGVAEGCVTDSDKAAVNAAVTAMSAVLAPIATNQDLTTDVMMYMLLNTTCYTQTARKEADIIDAKLRACPALLNETSVRTLNISGLEFSMLFTAFTSMDNFCECFPAMLQAGAIAHVAPMLAKSITNGYYGDVIDVMGLCAETPVNMTYAIPAVGEMITTCPSLIMTMNSPLLTTESILKMTGFVKSGHCDKNANASCTATQSTSTTFKHCMRPSNIGTDVTADEKSDRPTCRRSLCIEDYMNEPCGTEAATVFKWAVGMRVGSLSEVSLVDCGNSARTVVASLLVVALASVTTLFL